MKESDFCKVTDVATVRAALAVLRNIVPECGHDNIPTHEWQEVMQKVQTWDSRLVADTPDVEEG